MGSTGIGQAVSRKDGFLKVTGGAQYAADVNRPNMAHAVLVMSTVAKGKVGKVDTAEAQKMPHVQLILTPDNMEKLAEVPSIFAGGQHSQGFQPLQSHDIFHYGQTVAVVVADTLENATHAAKSITVEYEKTAEATVDIRSTKAQTVGAAESLPWFKNFALGDAEKAVEEAEVSLDNEYSTPVQHHNPIELYSCTAEWSADHLTIYEPSQWVYGLKNGIAQQLGIDLDKVRVVSPFVGGGFGCKASVMAHTAIAAIAAKKLRRPVKLVVTREQMYTAASFRGATRQRVALGATKEGSFTGLVVEQYGQTSRLEKVLLPGTHLSGRMYACPAIKTVEHLIHTDCNTPGFMRAPGEVPTMFALESAIDELAAKLTMDPVELRIRNEPSKDPIFQVPYSSRSLVECYRRGAELFGWQQRAKKPGEKRENGNLVGYGVATAMYPAYASSATARVRIDPDLAMRIQSGSHDLGTGQYTVLAQIASEELGIAVDKISVELGDTRYPAGALAGGSRTTASTGSAVKIACRQIREKLAKALCREGSPFAGAEPQQIVLREGKACDGRGRELPLPEAFAQAGVMAFDEYAEFIPPGHTVRELQALYKGSGAWVGPIIKEHMCSAYGAEFVEVHINPRTKTIRVPRMVGVFAAGKIINPKTARSQLLGGMIFGVGSALHEATAIDDRKAKFVNDNLADYLLPVNADIPHVEIEMLDEKDDIVNELGVKGIGELGIVGTAAALANAVYNATGIRIRDLPIHMEKLL